MSAATVTRQLAPQLLECGVGRTIKHMYQRFLPLFIVFASLCNFSIEQISTVPAAQDIADFTGALKNPPIFSETTALWQSGLQYQDTMDVRGSVASAEREEIQSPGQSPLGYHTKSALKFDDDGQLVSRIFEDSLGVSTTTNVWELGRLQNQAVKHHRNDGKFADWIEWRRWVYDAQGHLSEFHSGRDERETTTLVHFKYDSEGRSLGYELAGQTVTEISYDGPKITSTKLQKQQLRKVFEQIQVVDNKKRVIDLKVSDLSGGQLKLWYHVSFKYDDKDRVIEQNTDPFKLGSGDDGSPLPGKLVVEYDDENCSGEQKFYNSDGKLQIHARFKFDRDGILTKLRFVDASGNEEKGSELFVDPLSHKATTRPGNVEWEVIYDDRGNWTERRRWFTPYDGSARIMTRLVRQQITYR